MIAGSRNTSLHYTNAATLIQEGFQDTEDLDGLFSGLDPETGVYDAVSGHWGYEGSLGDRDGPDGRDEEASGRPDRLAGGRDGGPQGGPRLCHRRRGPAARRVAVGDDIRTRRPAATRPDLAAPPLRLPDPEAPLLPIHSGDGFPGVRVLAGGVHAGCRASLRQLRSRPDERPGLRPGLDPACRRRPDDPRRGHPAAPARQHRPSGWRHPGHARPFQHPGLDGRRDLV